MSSEMLSPVLRLPLPRATRAMLAALCLAACALPLQARGADAPHYQVELLVFLQPQGISAERPPQEASQPEEETTAPGAGPHMQPGSGAPPADAAGAGEAGETEEAPEAAALPEGFLPPAEPLELGASATALSRQGYRVLWHQAWVQPGGARGGIDLPVLAALGQGPADPGLTGAIGLSAGRNLHLAVTLEWRPDGMLEASMQQRRRVRAGSEHYFDHPRLGVLARVQRLEPAAAD